MITNWLLEIDGKAVAVTSDDPTVLTSRAKSFVAGFAGVRDENDVEMRSNWTYFDKGENFFTSFRVKENIYEVVVKKIARIFK